MAGHFINPRVEGRPLPWPLHLNPMAGQLSYETFSTQIISILLWHDLFDMSSVLANTAWPATHVLSIGIGR